MLSLYQNESNSEKQGLKKNEIKYKKIILVTI